MRNLIRIGALAFCFLAVALFISCENPIGLGTRVNTEVPVIGVPNTGSTDDIKPGSFLHGSSNTLSFEVTQEYGLDTVMVTVEYIDDNTGKSAKKTVPAAKDPNTGLWSIDLDVT